MSISHLKLTHFSNEKIQDILTSGGNQEKAMRISCENYAGLASMLLSTAGVTGQNDGTISYIFIFDFKASRLNLHVLLYVATCKVTLDLAEGLNKMWFCTNTAL